MFLSAKPDWPSLIKSPCFNWYSEPVVSNLPVNLSFLFVSNLTGWTVIFLTSSNASTVVSWILMFIVLITLGGYDLDLEGLKSGSWLVCVTKCSFFASVISVSV